jgi:hypothetical protein
MIIFYALIYELRSVAVDKKFAALFEACRYGNLFLYYCVKRTKAFEMSRADGRYQGNIRLNYI